MAASFVVSSLMGLVYVASGTVKLCRFVAPNVFDEQARKFKEFAQVFPLRPLGYTPDAALYQTVVGYVEVGLGVCLILGPRSIKRLACVGLMLIMTGAVQTLIFNKEYTMAPVPAAFFFVLYWLYGALVPKPKTD